MSKDLLDGVNRVLIKVGEIESRSTLTSLTDSSRQVFIDTAIDSWNEVVDEMFSLADCPRPNSIKTRSITLVQGQREYRLNSQLVTLRTEYQMIDETNSHTITLVDGGHRAIILGDLEQDDDGIPAYAALSPENGKLVMDVIPDAEAAGRIYKYRFEHDKILDDADDEFPFGDTVFLALVGAVAEKWKFHNRNGGDIAVYNAELARACHRLRQTPWRPSWAPVQVTLDGADPFASA